MDRTLDNLQKEEQSKIIKGSKLLAEYLGYVYIPFNDLQEYKKPGYYIQIEKKVFTPTSTNVVVMDIENLIEITSVKNGYVRGEKGLLKYLCRSAKDLRFFNSYDWLFDVIHKLEKETFEDTAEHIVIERNEWFWVAKTTYSYSTDETVVIEGNEILPDKEQLFFVLVAAVEKVNEIKTLK